MENQTSEKETSQMAGAEERVKAILISLEHQIDEGFSHYCPSTQGLEQALEREINKISNWTDGGELRRVQTCAKSKVTEIIAKVNASWEESNTTAKINRIIANILQPLDVSILCMEDAELQTSIANLLMDVIGADLKRQPWDQTLKYDILTFVVRSIVTVVSAVSFTPINSVCGAYIDKFLGTSGASAFGPVINNNVVGQNGQEGNVQQNTGQVQLGTGEVNPDAVIGCDIFGGSKAGNIMNNAVQEAAAQMGKDCIKELLDKGKKGAVAPLNWGKSTTYDTAKLDKPNMDHLHQIRNLLKDKLEELLRGPKFRVQVQTLALRRAVRSTKLADIMSTLKLPLKDNISLILSNLQTTTGGACLDNKISASLKAAQKTMYDKRIIQARMVTSLYDSCGVNWKLKRQFSEGTRTKLFEIMGTNTKSERVKWSACKIKDASEAERLAEELEPAMTAAKLNAERLGWGKIELNYLNEWQKGMKNHSTDCHLLMGFKAMKANGDIGKPKNVFVENGATVDWFTEETSLMTYIYSKLTQIKAEMDLGRICDRVFTETERLEDRIQTAVKSFLDAEGLNDDALNIPEDFGKTQSLGGIQSYNKASVGTRK
ncbi:MAG: hypothetical protein CENE_02624 [Candidatus Celerinatantimonas neptuna]|nr:MAG: hypothetical protein CENE_02624 [Candidatus Celerinatantimonas neptuna]